MRRTIAFVLVLAAVQWLGTQSALSQPNSTRSCPLYVYVESHTAPACRIEYGFTLLQALNLPAGIIVCNPGGVPWGDVGVSLGPTCGPPANVANDICLSCIAAGSPVNLSTGNTYIVESDISIPGLGGGLRLSRTWNSMLPQMQNSYPFIFGVNWRSTYEERLIMNSGDGYVKYLRPDGSVWSFAVVTMGTPNVYQAAAPANDKTTTITDGSTSWTVTFQSGEKRLFSATSGVLTSIVDRNGNTTQLSYDTSNRLVTVTDPASRHLSFSYVSPSSNLVSSVTSDAGITLSYAYDGQGRLTQVTKTDNTTISFQYDANSNLTTVLDTSGKVLESHTYDVLHRGLTSSRANGVDAVTVTYPQ